MTKTAAKKSPERTAAELLYAHARKCKKAPSECQVCVKNIAWFAELPLDVLSGVLEEA